ncbi:hypothetical protein KAW65_05565 [candidate division WOR-3 bacterium]|nr:hypothetical protein [candidate division WOR-3 bacterium]
MQKSKLQPKVIRKERLLDFPGKVLVKEGDKVKPEDIVAKTVYTARRPFIIEIADSLKTTPQDIRKYMLKKEGDLVKEDEILAKRRILLETKVRISPVDGIIEHISDDSGHILIREKEMDLTPRTINVADALRIKPKNIIRYMKKKVGDYVEKGGIIAEIPGLFLKGYKSPIYGEIKSINTETGKVIVQRPHQKVDLKAGISGEVEKVIPNYGVVIKTDGYELNGIIGFGRETFGKLSILEETVESFEAKILVSSKPLKASKINELKEKGVKGIILANLRAIDAEELFGKEVWSGVTGRIDKGITLIILDGFGTQQMKGELLNFFQTLACLPSPPAKAKRRAGVGQESHYVYLNGRTQIRAGVIRPEIIIS